MWRALATKIARFLVPVVGLVVLAAPQARETRHGVGLTSWLVVVDDPSSFDARTVVRRHGGAITREIPAIGVFVVVGDPGLGERLAAVPGIESVALSDEARASNAPARRGPRTTAVGIHGRSMAGYRARAPGLEAGADLPIDDDFYFGAQWSLDAIDVSKAWAAGQRGAGVRVAVLDTGVDPTHPDLAANLNLALARSFVPGQTWDVSTDAVQNVDHGTHVAGIIAAADNGFGIIGVAPAAEIVPVQVLARPSGHGSPDAAIAGIVYAANIGADVINLSVEYRRNRHGGINDRGTEDPSDDVPYTARDAALLMKAFSLATTYAHARGCTMIASGGNDAVDEDDERDEFVLPRDAPHVLGIAATGPLGWALDFETNLDLPTFYTNYGRSVIDLSAPGGNLDFDLLASGAVCTVGSGAVSSTLPCWFFDGVLSTAPVQGGFLYEFRRGTSMAAAHVSGVAALIIGRHGGAIPPGLVAARLRWSADDLGERGADAFYGRGRVNAYRAVQ